MPGQPITASPFNQPYVTDLRPTGAGGLNLRDDPDKLQPDELAIATNVWARGLGQLETRRGLAEIASGGTEVHSFTRLAEPLGSIATRVWGIDTELYIGLTGVLTQIDTGYSGDPLTLVPYRPTLSGQTWIYVADRDRMRKVRSDGLDLPIGIAAPATAPTLTLVTEQITQICQFDSTDSSPAASWQGNIGTAAISPAASDGGGAVSGNAVEFVTTSAAADESNPSLARYSFWNLARPLDLSVVGALPASDSDQIHLWIKFSNPSDVVEARLYFVVSETFDAFTLPGTEDGVNDQAYYKSFIPSLFAASVTTGTSTEADVDTAASTLATQNVLDTLGVRRRDDRGDSGQTETDTEREREERRRVPQEAGAGRHEWIEFGIPGRPLRRGDFSRIGSASGRDWSTITGIVVQLVVVTGKAASFAWDVAYLTGGYAPDSTEPGSFKFDARLTHTDLRTGDESNPSPEMAETAKIDAVRRAITVTPAAAYGDSSMRQNVYVRGGTVSDDWHFAGQNSADGAAFEFNLDAFDLAAGRTVELDHDEPVTTVDSNGATIRAQPVPILITVGDLLLGLGDPYRPGHLYWCIPGEPGHWPPQNTKEVCPPSEELMSGLEYGGQAYLFSRLRGYVAYPNTLEPGQVVVTSTGATRGLISRWALCIGERGIYGVDAYGIWVTTGGVSQEVADSLYPLFHRRAANGYNPIDMGAPEAMRLRAADGFIFFQYRDTTNVNRVAVYNERRNQWVGIWSFGEEVATIEIDAIRKGQSTRLLYGGRASGEAYESDEDTYNDSGATIDTDVRFGTWHRGQPREEKQFGDLVVEAEPRAEVSATTRLNHGTVVNNPATLGPATSRERYVVDGFGTAPQAGYNASLGLTWSDLAARTRIHTWGFSSITLPEVVVQRSTQWDDLGSKNEKYLTGILIDANTYGEDIPLTFEGDMGGSIITLDTATLNCSGRHRRFFSWPAVSAHLVRVRPAPDCLPWLPYEVAWIAAPEPPRIAAIDSGYENQWDTYYTGLDLEINTFGVAKLVTVEIDGTEYGPFSVTTNGQRVAHITLTPGFGHVYRYFSEDDVEVLLYGHRWQITPAPSEQTNWNQPHTVYGTLADKWIKGFALLFNSGGATKTIGVEIDGTVVESVTAAAGSGTDSGPKSVFVTLSEMRRGRVVRLLPSDANASRLWEALPIFDEEPLSLAIWETQPSNFGVPGFGTPLWGYITLRSAGTVTLTVTSTIGEDGTTSVQARTLASTASVKRKLPVTFEAVKGLLHQLKFTAAAAFYLYQEESELWYQPWGAPEPIRVAIFGNFDVDVPPRQQAPPAASAPQPAGVVGRSPLDT